MRIIGLRIEKYIDKVVSGHNCDFKYEDSEFERHVICGVLDDNRKVEITLWQSEGECGSGWTTASFGHINVELVNKFGGYNYIPKTVLTVTDIEPDFDPSRYSLDNYTEGYSNDVFTISEYGGDTYYPCGFYNVNMNLFKVLPRVSELRPVWIFTGPSNIGKTFLASKLNDLGVYETDSSDILPDVITEEIIVLGNKYKFDIDEIKKRLFGDVEVRIVEFK
jgi:hypothetical protein